MQFIYFLSLFFAIAIFITLRVVLPYKSFDKMDDSLINFFEAKFNKLRSGAIFSAIGLFLVTIFISLFFTTESASKIWSLGLFFTQFSIFLSLVFDQYYGEVRRRQNIRIESKKENP